MLSRMGNAIPFSIMPSSILLKREPCKFFRFWSYLVSSFAALVKRRHLPEGDLAITVSDYFCDVIPALLLKKKHGMKWIAWVHHREAPPSERPGNRLVNTITWRIQLWSFKQIAKHADQVWVYDSDAGDVLARQFRGLGMPENRIRLMHNGVELEEIQAAPQTEPKYDAVVVGVRPSKGAYDIVPIWLEVQKLLPGATLRLMGGISCRAEISDQILAAGLEDTISLFDPDGGWLSPREHFAAIKSARILMAPSHEEGWGIALCEAMGCGLPVVSYDLPVYHRIFGEALLTSEVRNHESIASNVVRLLTNPELFEAYRKKGLECARRYDWDLIANEDWAALPQGG